MTINVRFIHPTKSCKLGGGIVFIFLSEQIGHYFCRRVYEMPRSHVANDFEMHTNTASGHHWLLSQGLALDFKFMILGTDDE